MSRRWKVIPNPTYGDLREASPTAIAPDEWPVDFWPAFSWTRASDYRRPDAMPTTTERLVRGRRSIAAWATMRVRPTLSALTWEEVLGETVWPSDWCRMHEPGDIACEVTT